MNLFRKLVTSKSFSQQNNHETEIKHGLVHLNVEELFSFSFHEVTVFWRVSIDKKKIFKWIFKNDIVRHSISVKIKWTKKERKKKRKLFLIGENEILSDYDGLDQIRLFHLWNIFFFSHKFQNGKKEIINLKK